MSTFISVCVCECVCVCFIETLHHQQGASKVVRVLITCECVSVCDIMPRITACVVQAAAQQSQTMYQTGAAFEICFGLCMCVSMCVFVGVCAQRFHVSACVFHMPEPSALHHSIALRHFLGAKPQRVVLSLFFSFFLYLPRRRRGVGESGEGGEVLRLRPTY